MVGLLKQREGLVYSSATQCITVTSSLQQYSRGLTCSGKLYNNDQWTTTVETLHVVVNCITVTRGLQQYSGGLTWSSKL